MKIKENEYELEVVHDDANEAQCDCVPDDGESCSECEKVARKRIEEQIKDAYETGHDRGWGFGNGIEEVSEEDKRSAPCDCEEDEACSECLFQSAGEIEIHARQYSPFEFIASEFNKDINSEVLWEYFDEGITDGIRDGIKERLDRNEKIKL